MLNGRVNTFTIKLAPTRGAQWVAAFQPSYSRSLNFSRTISTAR
jgi:hypothetical protein